MIESLQDFFYRHKILISFLFFLGVGGYLLVMEFWYFGTAQFYISEKNTTISLEKKGEKLCTSTQCTYELTPNIYKFSVAKDNFETAYGTVEISMNHISEVKVSLTQKSTQIKENTLSLQKKSNVQSFSEKSPYFPENFSLIDSSSDNISSTEKRNSTLLWKNIPIKKNIRDLKILVSSDEIGRGFWIVSQNSVQRFSPRTQKISLFFQNRKEEISEFLPLFSGEFIVKISGKLIYKPHNKKEKILPIRPLSLSAICLSGNNFLYLEHKGGEVEVKKLHLKTSEISSWGVLENFPLSDFYSLQCYGKSQAIVFFNTHKSITLEKK